MPKRIPDHLPKFNLGIHFVTKNLHRKTPLFLNRDLAFILLEELDFYRSYMGFKIFAYVIMPEHFHLLIWWDYEQKPDITISKIMRSINSVAARRILKYFEIKALQPDSVSSNPISGSREHVLPATLASFRINPSKELGLEHTPVKNKIWQDDLYDFNILTERKLKEKINYIHQNPYRDPRIKNPARYPFSSERFYLYNEEGVLKIDSLEDR